MPERVKIASVKFCLLFLLLPLLSSAGTRPEQGAYVPAGSTPLRTGSDTGIQSAASVSLQRIALVASGLGVGYGLWSLDKSSVAGKWDAAVRAEVLEDAPNFRTHIDNYLPFVPAAAVLSLQAAGVPGRDPMLPAIGLYGLSGVLAAGAVYGLKSWTHELRPDGSSYNSFPSGHTAAAFASAAWLDKEYGRRYPWVVLGGYLLAGGTGALRVYNNRHWLGDVIAGAAFGYLSVQASYAVYPWIEKHILDKHPKTRVWLNNFPDKAASSYPAQKHSAP